MSERRESPDTVSGAVNTGWSVIAENPSTVTILDKLLSMPPHREFNKTEVAELAGVSRRSVHEHLDTLLTLGIVAAVEATSPQRYRFDSDSEVSRALIELDGAVSRQGPAFE